MVRVFSDSDVASILELEDVLDAVAEAFERQLEGAVERPERPHYPLGIGVDEDAPDEPTGTGLCMPAYVHGSTYAATKLATVCPANADRGLPTVDAQISLVDVETGRPVAYLAGTRITNARTGCIGGLAARELALEGPVDLGVIGAGTQARWQTRAIDATTELESIRVYSPSDSSEACADDLEGELDVPATAVPSPREAVDDADVVVTATTSEDPVFPGNELSPGTLVVAVGAYAAEMRELDDETISRSDRVFADVPNEARETGDLAGHPDLEVVEFGEALVGTDGRQGDEEIIVLSSVGSAVLDAATAEYVYERGVEKDVGSVVSL